MLGAFPPRPQTEQVQRVLPNDKFTPPSTEAMNRHVEAFLEMQAAERGAARNTWLAYAADLRGSAAFAAGRGARRRRRTRRRR